MQVWLNSPIKLEGRLVVLLPLEEIHLPGLAAVARDKQIWTHYAYDGSDPERFAALYADALQEMHGGNQYTFVICERSTGRILGSTKYMDIQAQHRKLEIGTTWMDPSVWGTMVNTECKLLLLTYAFEVLGAVRVQLKTDENNIRSRKAIEKIGGRFEGVLRNDIIRENGTHRNSAYYSIIPEEWPLVKENLAARLL